MRILIAATAALAMLSTPALAKNCRDAKGKFIKCAATAPVKAARCKDAKGRFAKCGMPGAHAV